MSKMVSKGGGGSKTYKAGIPKQVGSTKAPTLSMRKGVDSKWGTRTAWKPSPKISDEDLQRVKKTFFEIDRDASGSIDIQELTSMLKALGQTPSDADLKVLIESAEDGPDKDGKIQLREFINLYAKAVGTKCNASIKEVEDCYRALGGVPDADPAKTSNVDKAALKEMLLRDYDLDVDVDSIFDGVPASQTSVTLQDLLNLLQVSPQTTLLR